MKKALAGALLALAMPAAAQAGTTTTIDPVHGSVTTFSVQRIAPPGKQAVAAERSRCYRAVSKKRWESVFVHQFTLRHQAEWCSRIIRPVGRPPAARYISWRTQGCRQRTGTGWQLVSKRTVHRWGRKRFRRKRWYARSECQAHFKLQYAFYQQHCYVEAGLLYNAYGRRHLYAGGC